MSSKLPFRVPAANEAGALAPGASVPDVDTGGYDVMVGGHGFRLATDQQNPFVRGSDPVTVHRFDSSLEPGEQTLSQLPWIKSQSSFNGGAGQLNLEQGFTAFQYDAEQVEHIRFDSCQGVNVWTPGKVSRLPDTRVFNFGFVPSCMVTAAAGGVDYAIVGGVGSFAQLAWTSGPDANPVSTSIDLSGATYGGASNCTIASLATDGVNYFALIHLTVVGSTPNVKSIIASGVVGSVSAPSPIYDLPSGTRTNLCTNPNFESGATTSWTAIGGTPPSISSATSQHQGGTHSMQVVWNATSSGNGVSFTVPTTAGHVYTVSLYLYSPVGGNGAGVVNITNGGVLSGGNRGITTQWVRVSQTWTATSTSSDVQILSDPLSAPTVGFPLYIDSVLIEEATQMGNYFDGSSPTDTYSYAWSGTTNASTSVGTSVVSDSGVIGWSKSRLIGGLGPAVYELSTQVSAHSPIPAPRYTYPSSKWTWTAVSESPSGVLLAGMGGQQASIIQLSLDTTGAVPTLAGGTTIAVLPPGEIVYSLDSYLASFLGITTTTGIRVGTFDTYTGALKLGPASVVSTAPVYGAVGRDRFIYAGYTNQQPDGKTGLVAIDLSMVTDTSGRNAWAPDMRPPSTAATGLGTVTAVDLLPLSNRLVFLSTDGVHVEGGTPGSDGDAWIRTSRIRYDTAEMKLFKLGRVHGSLASSSIQAFGITPYSPKQNLGTFGFITSQDPGEFSLPGGLNEWIQIEFHLIGSTCILNSYQTKAYPAPQRQHVITFTVNCYRQEVDRYGLDVTDPETPRQRFQNVQDLEAAGNEIRFVEFTNTGPVAQLVIIDQMQYQSQARPTITDDFGGLITFKLRTTEG